MYYALGNIGDSKKTDSTRVNDATDPKEFIVEIMDNTLPNSTFSGSDEALAALDADQFDEEGTYGFRYEMDGITDEQREENMATWRSFYRFVVNSTDEEFVAQLGDWFVLDAALYYYLFTERYTMIDNRGKNSFWHYAKCEDGIYRFDFSDYDNDTAIGINNSGELTMTYGKEDTDYRTDGDPSSGYVFNAAESTFFCRIRDLMYDQLAAMFVNRESQNCWSATSLINQFDEWQSEFPEEVWRLDIERKYLRTYRDGNTRFLVSMMNGRKKYQRRQFERDQEKYMATKYFGTTATDDQIMFRCNTPTTAVVTPNYTLHLTPYANMYLSVMFGATYRKKVRAKAGTQYDIECPFTTMDDTAVLIYCASQIQAIGDLSGCYIHDNDFSNASKLQELVIGNATTGYQNTFLTNLTIGNNTLLRILDIQNTPNLAQALNLSKLGNLEELYAFGSGLTGLTFADGGRIQIAELPSSITSLTMRDLAYLTGLDVKSFDNLATLTIENCDTIDVKAIFDEAPNLNRVRITGINWTLDSTDLLDRIYDMSGIDKNGHNLDKSVLSGYVHVPVVREKLLSEYNEAWPDLEIEYDTLITQFTVTFVNDDDNKTVLDIQYVDKGSTPVDPTTREDSPIATPTKASTVSTDFTFSGWDTAFTSVFADQTITAVYTETVRSYTIKFASKGTVLQSTTDKYGSSVIYTGDTPTYTSEEAAYVYYWFTGWDQFGYVDGDKTINAVYDKFEYTNGCFDNLDLSEMRPVQIYAMMKLNLYQNYVSVKDNISFDMGADFSYTNINEELLISEETVFNGSNYIDTKINLLAEDSGWVLAIDYKWASENSTNAVLAQCYQGDGSNGFRLRNSSGTKLFWGTNSTSIASEGSRDVLVIRHIKGETALHVYKGALPAAELTYTSLSATRAVTTNGATLVFGCSKADDGVYESYAKGSIYWAKLWYADLGDTACRELAMWTHESISLDVYGFRQYYLGDSSGSRSSISFLASKVLENSMQLNSTTANTGGWAAWTLNTILNNRFYNSIPIEWRQLIKQVKISGTKGGGSSEIVTSNCYISIPAIIQLDSSYNYEPYTSEGGVGDTQTIPYMTSNTERIRCTSDGTAVGYWTRSPYVSYNNYIFSIDETGYVNGFNYGIDSKYVVIEISF